MCRLTFEAHLFVAPSTSWLHDAMTKLFSPLYPGNSPAAEELLHEARSEHANVDWRASKGGRAHHLRICSNDSTAEGTHAVKGQRNSMPVQQGRVTRRAAMLPLRLWTSVQHLETNADSTEIFNVQIQHPSNCIDSKPINCPLVSQKFESSSKLALNVPSECSAQEPHCEGHKLAPRFHIIATRELTLSVFPRSDRTPSCWQSVSS